MESNTAIVFKRTKKLLAKIAKKQGFPMHYNSIMICINMLFCFVGPKVHYELNDLDDDKISDIFYNRTWETLYDYPPEEPITKATMAAFIQTLDSSLVGTEVSEYNFAEEVFAPYL